MPSVIHVLPHRGEGADTYLDVLESMEGFDQERTVLTHTRRPAPAALEIARRLPALRRRARHSDLLHLHGEVGSFLCLPLLRGRPSVVTLHGLHLLRRSHGARRPLALGVLRAIVSAADRTICVSDSEHEEAAAALPVRLRDRLAVVHNGLAIPPLPTATERAVARGALGLDDGTVVFCYVGQLEERKDPLVAVRAAGEARRRGAPVELLVAGDGPLLEEVKAQAGPGVRALGRRDDVGSLLAAADAFVLPSRREGLSYALLEAMARGLPAVAADGPGNAEALGEAGVVLPAGSQERFTEAFTALAGDSERRAALGRRARERVVERFSAEGMVRRTRAVYTQVLSG